MGRTGTGLSLIHIFRFFVEGYGSYERGLSRRYTALLALRKTVSWERRSSVMEA